MKRRPQAKMDIDVVPYLSIMVIVLKLVCLILIVMVMPIALNPHMLNVISFSKLKRITDLRPKHVKVPTYLDCRPDGVQIIPGDQFVAPGELRQSGNPVERLIAKAEQNKDDQYLILLIRPNSLPVYRFIRKMVGRRDIDVGFDVIDTGTKLDWRAEAKELNIQNPE